MTCTSWDCSAPATRCARTSWDSGRVRHYPVCDDHFSGAQRGEALTLESIGYAAGLIIPCPEHDTAQTERSIPMAESPAADQSDDEHDDDVATSTPKTKRKPKKKLRGPHKAAAPKATQLAKIDPADALGFCRARLRDAGDDVIAQAFWKREIAKLEETFAKVEEQKRKSLRIGIAGGKHAAIGDHLFELEDHFTGYARGGRKAASAGLTVHEYVVKDIKSESRSYGSPEKVAVLSKVGGGTKTAKNYDLRRMYAERRAAIDHEVNGCVEELEGQQEQVDELTRKRDALLALRNAAPVTSSTTSTKPSDSLAMRTGKRWTEVENDYLRDATTEGVTPEAMAEWLGRPRDRVVRQLHKLGLKSSSTPFHDFGRKPKSEEPSLFKNGDPDDAAREEDVA